MAGTGTVFISHAREDAARGAALVKWLEAWGVRYWLETRSDDAGQLAQNTQTALAESMIFLRICTPAANRSYWMSLEMGAFLSTQADEHRRGVASSRTLVSLILDPKYQRQPFDHSGTIVDATNKPQAAWLNELRAAFGMPPLTGDDVAPSAKAEVPVTTATMSRRRVLGAGIAGTAALAVAGSAGLLLVERKRGGAGAGGASVTPTPEGGAPPSVRDPNLAWWYKADGGVTTAPAVGNGAVYFVTDSGSILAVDTKKHTAIWSDNGAPKITHPGVLGATHVFFEGGATVFGLDPQTGKQTWTSGLVIGAPLIENGLVFMGNLSTIDAALESNQRAYVWTADTSSAGNPNNSSDTGAAVSSMAISGNVLYAGTEGGTVFAFDISNASVNLPAGAPEVKARQIWTYKTGGKILSRAAIANGIVYIGSDDHYLHAIDAKTGQRRWAFKTGDAVETSPVVFNGLVGFASNDNVFYAVDAAKGTEAWRFVTGTNAILSSPIVDGGKVYVASGSSSAKYIYALDPASGSVMTKYATGSTINVRPTIADGYMYVGCQDHYLYVFKVV